MTLYSIGHSQRPAAAFIDLLRDFAVSALVDVRAVPRSRRHPHFERAALAPALATAGIEYLWWGAALGGMRKPRAGSPHVALAADGLRGYADHMADASFQAAAAALATLAATRVVAFMCAEADFRHCHRQLLADYLVLRGAELRHIVAPGTAVAHEFHPALGDDRPAPVYNRHAQGDLFD